MALLKTCTKDWERQGFLLSKTGSNRKVVRKDKKRDQNCLQTRCRNLNNVSEIPAFIDSEEDSGVACMAVAPVVTNGSSLPLLESAITYRLTRI